MEPAPPPSDEAETEARKTALRQRLRGLTETAPQEETFEEPETSPDGVADSGFGDDPLVDDAEDDAYASEATPFDEDFAASYAEDGEYEEDVSQFEYRAPFTARRNPAKMWTIAAALFALMASGTVLAVNYYGLPDWLPFPRPAYGIGQSDLVLDFPKANQTQEALPSGEKILQVRGSINNVGRSTVSVPNLVAVFTDERGREVFAKVIVPAKSELAPGETLKVTEGISGYPESAIDAGIGWAPN